MVTPRLIRNLLENVGREAGGNPWGAGGQATCFPTSPTPTWLMGVTPIREQTTNPFLRKSPNTTATTCSTSISLYQPLGKQRRSNVSISALHVDVPRRLHRWA